MKSRIFTGILLILLLGSLLMPIYSIYPHMNLPAEVAEAFPAQVTGAELIFKGNAVLPLDAMPSLAALPFRQGLLAAGILLTLLGGLMSLTGRRWLVHTGVWTGFAGMLLLFLYAFYAQQLDKSMLFDVMINAKWFLWAVFAQSAALLGLDLWQMKRTEPIGVGTRGWRLISAGLCAAALLILLLPFAETYVPAGTFSTAQEDALAARQISGLQWLIGGEPQLKQLAAENGAFSDPASDGAMAGLVTLSASSKDVRNLFMIPTYTGSVRALAIAACVLLFAGFAFSLLRRVDRWIPAAMVVTGSVILLMEVVGTLAVDSQYQFLGATYQMMFLGLGGYTPMPLLMVGLAAAASMSAVLGIRRANEPYFVNPIPQRKRILVVSITLAAVSAALLMTPVYQVGLYTPGKSNAANATVTQAVSGLDLILQKIPDALMNPANTRGRALYSQEAAQNGLTLSGVQALISGSLNRLTGLAFAAMALALASLMLMFLPRRRKKAVLAVLLSGGAMQAVMAIVPVGLLPRDVGYITALGPLYVSLGFTAFSAFFAGFMDKEELPKKYKLFLMMLPFLVAVFLFSYLPLYGWSYAFYNYKFGVSMDQQEFVGFKWFTELVLNPGHRSNIARVMSNTFAMSGLGILTSWMPMAFAILLNEVNKLRFKKFVQIFTTLPNFISWTLVFSFALAMFAMDTGIYSKFMLGVGAIDKPVAWLNSSEHIWIKMWAWSVWKGLGWGAIMYLAAIAGIDQELYEAARVDGAGRWRQIFHITLPGLLPTFFVLLLLSISNLINNGMDQYLVFQNSMNKDTIEVLDLYVYNITIASTSSNMYSFGTAIGVLKTLFSVMLLFAANFASKMLRGESIV